jgi:hypothetical protein
MTASFALVGAVGKIEADHVDAGANHVANHGLGVGGGSERGDNLGAALRRGIRQVQIGKGHGAGATSPEGPAFGRKPVGAAKALHEREHDAEARKKAEAGGGENHRAGVELVIEDGGSCTRSRVSGGRNCSRTARVSPISVGPSSTWATSVVMTSRAGKNMSIPE